MRGSSNTQLVTRSQVAGQIYKEVFLIEKHTMFTINVELRPEAEQGKGASRRLRTENKFPAIVYGGSAAPVSIKLDHDSVKNMEVKAEFYSETITLVIDGKDTLVKVQAVQRHPFKPKLAHIDFVRV
jgi:large subunit ribosomal protein L25